MVPSSGDAAALGLPPSEALSGLLTVALLRGLLLTFHCHLPSFSDGAELFDAAAFGLPPPEALLVDPQQRLLLECTAEAMTASGQLQGSFQAASSAGVRARFGVYVGASSVDYMKLCMTYHQATSAYSATGGRRVHRKNGR